MKPTAIESFWDRVEKTDSCWIWVSTKDRHGYGVISGGSRVAANIRAHRYAYEQRNGPIPVGLCVLHNCDNPSCVNPDHLRAGTKHENSLDMKSRGRSTAGEKDAMAKLTECDVLRLREMYSTGRYTQDALAVLFGVCRQAVSHIWLRKRWAHI